MHVLDKTDVLRRSNARIGVDARRGSLDSACKSEDGDTVSVCSSDGKLRLSASTYAHTSAQFHFSTKYGLVIVSSFEPREF